MSHSQRLNLVHIDGEVYVSVDQNPLSGDEFEDEEGI